MKRILALTLPLFLFGCVTPKIKVPPQANQVKPYNTVVATFQKCMHVSHIEIPKQHPNNFQRFIMRETYNAGGTHYEILFSEKDRKDRPISGEFNIYYCQEKPEEVVKQPVVQQAIQPQMPYVININNQ